MAGSGILNDPYLIETVSDWSDIGTHYPTPYYYKLINDLDFSGSAINPIASFNGYIDGNYKRLKYFTIKTAEDNSGLFGLITSSNAEYNIKNLEIYSGSVDSTTTNNFGYLAGKLENAKISNVHIASCSNHINNEFNGISDGGFGFFAGNVINSTIVSSSVKYGHFDFYDSYSYDTAFNFGGFVGRVYNSNIIDSFSDVNIYNVNHDSNAINLGGFVGYVDGSNTEILNCHSGNYITIDINSSSDYIIGGFAGYVNDCNLFENCYSNIWFNADAPIGTYFNGFVGYSVNDNYNNCFFNLDRALSGQNSSYCVISGRSDKQSNSIVRLNDAEMKSLENYTEIDNYYLIFNGSDTVGFDKSDSITPDPYFEDKNGSYWEVIDGTVTFDSTEVGQQGDYCIELNGESSIISIALSNMISNTEYIAKIRYKSSVTITISDANDNVYKQLPPKGNWDYTEFYFTSTTSVTQKIKISIPSGGVAWLDSLYIVENTRADFDSVNILDDDIYNKALELNGTGEQIYTESQPELAGFNISALSGSQLPVEYNIYGDIDNIISNSEIGSSKCLKVNTYQEYNGIYRNFMLNSNTSYKAKIRYKSDADIVFSSVGDYEEVFYIMSATTEWNMLEFTFNVMNISTYIQFIMINYGTFCIEYFEIYEDVKNELNSSNGIIKHSKNRKFELSTKDNILVNSGYSGATDWIDTNNDGLADYYSDINGIKFDGFDDSLQIDFPVNIITNNYNDWTSNGTKPSVWIQGSGTFTWDASEPGQTSINSLKIQNGGPSSSIGIPGLVVGKKYKLKVRAKCTFSIGYNIRIGAPVTLMNATSQWNTVYVTFIAIYDTLYLSVGSGIAWFDIINITEDYGLDITETRELIQHSKNRNFEQILGNNLITNGANWIDSNSDGLANDWANGGLALEPTKLTGMVTSSGWDTFIADGLNVISAITSTTDAYMRTGNPTDMYLVAGTYRILFDLIVNTGGGGYRWRISSSPSLSSPIGTDQTFNTTGTYSYTASIASDGTYYWGITRTAGTLNFSILNASIRLESTSSIETFSIISGSGWSDNAQRVYNPSGSVSIKHTGSLYNSGSKYIISGLYRSSDILTIFKNNNEYYAQLPTNSGSKINAFSTEILLTDNNWFFGVSGSSTTSTWMELDNIIVNTIPNLITNGTFSGNSDGWGLNDLGTYDNINNKLNIIGPSVSDLYCYSYTFIFGRRYKITFEVSNYTSGDLYGKVGNTGTVFSLGITGNGIISMDFTAEQNGLFYFDKSSTLNGSIDNIHIYEIVDYISYGNHFANISLADRYAGTGSLLISSSGTGSYNNNYISLNIACIDSASIGNKYTLDFWAKPIINSSSLTVGIGTNTKSFTLNSTSSWTNCIWNIDNYDNSFTNQDIKMWLGNSGSVYVDTIKYRKAYDFAVVSRGIFNKNVINSGSWDLLLFGSDTSYSSSMGYGLIYDNNDGIWAEMVDNGGNLLYTSASITQSVLYESIIWTVNNYRGYITSSIYLNNILKNYSVGNIGIIEYPTNESSSINQFHNIKGWVGHTQFIRFDDINYSNLNPNIYFNGNSVVGGGTTIPLYFDPSRDKSSLSSSIKNWNNATMVVSSSGGMNSSNIEFIYQGGFVITSGSEISRSQTVTDWNKKLLVSQSLNTGSVYRLEFYYKTNGVLNVKNGNYTVATASALTSSYGFYEGTFLCTSPLVYMQASSGSWIEVDKWSMKEIPNLVSNGTFSNGTTGFSVDVASISTNGQSAYVTATGTGAIFKTVVLQNPNTLFQNKRYRLNYEVLRTTGGWNGMTLNGYNSLTAFSTATAGTGSKSIDFLYPDSQSQIRWEASASVAGDVLQIDNIHLYELSDWKSNGNHTLIQSTQYVYSGSYSGRIEATGTGSSTTNYVNLAYIEFNALSQYKKYILEFKAIPSVASASLTVGIGTNTKSFTLNSTSTWTNCLWNIDNYDNSFTNQDIKMWLGNSGSVWVDELKVRQNYDIALVTSGKFIRNTSYTGSWDLMIFGSETTDSSSVGYSLSYDNFNGLWGDFVDNNGNLLSVSASIAQNYYYDSIILVKNTHRESTTASLYINNSLAGIGYGTLGLMDIPYSDTSSANPSQNLKGWLGRTQLIRFDNISASNFNPVSYNFDDTITGGGKETVVKYTWKDSDRWSENSNDDEFGFKQLFYDKSTVKNDLTVSGLTLNSIQTLPFMLITGSLVINSSSLLTPIQTNKKYNISFNAYASGNNALPMDLTMSLGNVTKSWTNISYNSGSPSILSYNFTASSAITASSIVFNKQTAGIVNMYNMRVHQAYDMTLNIMMHDTIPVDETYLLYLQYGSGSFAIKTDVDSYLFELYSTTVSSSVRLPIAEFGTGSWGAVSFVHKPDIGAEIFVNGASILTDNTTKDLNYLNDVQLFLIGNNTDSGDFTNAFIGNIGEMQLIQGYAFNSDDSLYLYENGFTYPQTGKIAFWYKFIEGSLEDIYGNNELTPMPAWNSNFGSYESINNVKLRELFAQNYGIYYDYNDGYPYLYDNEYKFYTRNSIYPHQTGRIIKIGRIFKIEWNSYY